MKVLQINSFYKNGGSTGRIAYDLKTLSEEYGIENHVAFGYEFIPTADPDTFRMEGMFGYYRSILMTRLFASHGFDNIWETLRLIRYMDKVRPDVIHLHNIHSYYIHVGMLFRYIKRHNIPVIWTLHDSWSITGWCTGFDYVQCDKWREGCHHCPLQKEYPKSWFLDRSRSNWHKKRKTFSGVRDLTIVTPSEWLADLVRQSYLKDYPVMTLNNGIDTDIFLPTPSDIKKELGIDGKRMILSMAMYMMKAKGIDYLLQLRDMLNDNERLVLVGVEAKDVPMLENGRCICLPQTPDVNFLVRMYSAADIFINTTLQDTFPTTNLESLACGTPVVTFATGGSVESVDEETGEIVPQRDTPALLAAIRRVCDKGKAYYAPHCREKALRLYNKRTQFEKYIELYRAKAGTRPQG